VSSLRAVSAGVLAVVLVACSGGGTVGELDEVLDGDVALDEVDLDLDALGLPVAVEVSPAVVGPGERVTVTAEGAPGATVALLRGGEVVAEAPLADGRLTVPTDAEDGMHTVQVERDEALVGVAGVRVASEPGVWLASDRRYAAEGEAFTLRLTAHEVPDDAVVVIGPEGLLDDDWEDDFDDDDWWDDDFDDDWDDEWFDDPDAVVTIYVPHPAGALVPIGGMQLAAPDRLPRLGDVAGIDLAVPAATDLTRPLQATVFTHGGPAASWTSNTVSVERCDQPGAVVGSTDGPALVSAVWTAGGLQVNRVEADGPFELATGPGLVAVTTTPLDGEATQELADVPCGGEAVLASADPSPAVAPALHRPAALGSAAGGGGEPCRRAYVMVSVGSGDAAVAAGFVPRVAAQLRSSLGRLTVTTEADVRAVLQREAEAQLRGEGDDGDLNEALEMTEADFLVVVNFSRFGGQDLLFVTVHRLEPLHPGVSREMHRGPDLRAAPPPVGVQAAEETRRASVCGEVDPDDVKLSVDEEQVLEFEVTDLADGDADGAKISVRGAPECGELDPEEATVEGRHAEMTYTATAREEGECVDNLTFEVDWPDGQPQPVRDGVPATVRVGGNYRLEMGTGIAPEAAMDAGVPMFFAANAELEATACGGGILGEWEGTFELDFQLFGPFVGTAAEEGAFPVRFFLPEAGGRFTIMGIDQFGMYGEYYPTAEYVAVWIDGDVLIAGPIEQLPEDAPC
jgi:hypothetical protein